MTNEEFIEIAIQSAQIYRDWLSKNNDKGISSIDVDRYEILESSIKLQLRSKLSYPDDAQIKIYNEVYTRDQILIIKNDIKNKVIYIRPRDELMYLFVNLPQNQIKVISDMKFLIKRVQTWYSKFTGELTIPTIKPSIPPQIPKLSLEPSPEQQQAYNGIANSPFSYIWGAPGTGKTQFVLARAVLAYCKLGKPVLIVAPTNNAVEQTMKGVLSVLEEAEIPFEKVLRLGTPSAEFYAKYPMVCELRAVEDQIKELDDRQSICNKTISFYETDEWCNNTERTFNEAILRINSIVNILGGLQAKIVEEEKELKVVNARLAPILSEIDRLNEEREKLIGFLRVPRNKVTVWIQRKKMQRAELEKNEVEKKLAEQGNEYKHLMEEQKQINDKLKHFREKVSTEEEERNTAFLSLRNISPSPVASFSSEFISIMESISFDHEYLERLTKARQSLSNIRSIIENKRQLYSSSSIEQAQKEKKEIEIEKESLYFQSSSRRLQDCLVVAATVDTYIHKLADAESFHPCHVFLDEAAYCPLIKAAILLSRHIPLTLLGDHMQLTPICTMDTYDHEKEKDIYICLWAQSALYLETIFTESIQSIANQYEKDKKNPSKIVLPKFSKMHIFTLHETFRFGEELASVLAHYVYSPEFKGNPNIQTEIIVINAPHSQNKDKTSPDECKSIKDYLKKHTDINDFAILTPYKNQRALFTRSFSWDNALTIHSSQGQEWETVFISVVATTAHGFLTHRLINTAVSRAQKKLILVCDANYWSGCKEHIIGGLVDIAKPAV